MRPTRALPRTASSSWGFSVTLYRRPRWRHRSFLLARLLYFLVQGGSTASPSSSTAPTSGRTVPAIPAWTADELISSKSCSSCSDETASLNSGNACWPISATTMGPAGANIWSSSGCASVSTRPDTTLPASIAGCSTAIWADAGFDGAAVNDHRHAGRVLQGVLAVPADRRPARPTIVRYHRRPARQTVPGFGSDQWRHGSAMVWNRAVES